MQDELAEPAAQRCAVADRVIRILEREVLGSHAGIALLIDSLVEIFQVVEPTGMQPIIELPAQQHNRIHQVTVPIVAAVKAEAAAVAACVGFTLVVAVGDGEVDSRW